MCRSRRHCGRPADPRLLHRPRGEKISTSIFERFCTISRPRIASTALAKILGREIVRFCTILLVEIFGSGGRAGGRVAVGVRTFDTGGVGFNNPSWSWAELEAALSGRARARDDDAMGLGRDGRAPGSPSWNAGGDGPAWSRKRQPFEPPADAGRAAAGTVALRRAALPLQLLLPRRRVAPRGAGRGGRPARPRGAGAHRPRRLLRRGPLRRGGPGGRPADRVRRRAHARHRPRPARSSATRRPRAPGRHRPDADRHAPDPHGDHLAGARRRPGRLRPRWPGRSAAATWRGRRARRSSPSTTSPRGRAGDVLGAHRLPQGRGAGGAGRATARPRPAASWTGWSTPSARDRVVVELWDHGDPLDSARNDALAELAAAARRRRASPPTTSTTPRPPQRRLATALAAVRARRSLDELDGWLPGGRRRPPAQSGPSRRAASPATPGVVERAAEIGRAAAFDLSLVAPNAAAVPVPATGCDEMEYLRQLAEDGARRRYGDRPAGHGERRRRWRQGVGADRPRARRHRARSASPATSSSSGTSSSSAGASDIFCQGRGSGGQLGGLLRPRHHQRRRRGARPAVRAVPVARARRAAGHRHRHRERPARGGHPVRLRRATAASTPPRWPTSSPTGPSRRCATWPRRSATRPGQQDAWSQAGRRAGARVAITAEPAPDHDIPDAVLELAARGRGRAAAPRHPLRRHGDLRPAGDRGVPGRVGAGWTTAASCSGTRTTAPRPGW